MIWEEVLGLSRSRHLILTQGTFTATEALSWGAIAEVVAIRQRLSRRMAEGTVLGMALEGITAANMPYLDQR